jgi:SAM-dependent methyltransferase
MIGGVPSATIDIATLAAAVAHNRFLPVPPPELHFVGDGDFRAIGAEFLRYFVELGGLAPHHRVLDIGCGVGRMALPLTQYLDAERGSYDGVDIVADGIGWCRDRLQSVYQNFHFHRLDLKNELYNPEGAQACADVRLPFADGAFDFVFLTSVFTHLRVPDIEGYAHEIGRALADGGRCFLSLFLMTAEARRGLKSGACRLTFDTNADGPEYLADPEHPSAAIAYDEGFLVGSMAAAGLHPARPFAYGHWAGGQGENYQDICLFTKTAEAKQ